MHDSLNNTQKTSAVDPAQVKKNIVGSHLFTRHSFFNSLTAMFAATWTHTTVSTLQIVMSELSLFLALLAQTVFVLLRRRKLRCGLMGDTTWLRQNNLKKVGK